MQFTPSQSATDYGRSRNSLKMLMWSLTPPVTMRLYIPSLGLHKEWAGRLSPARCFVVVSLGGFRERHRILTPQFLAGLSLPITRSFRQATPRSMLRSLIWVALHPSTMRRPPPSACASLIAQATIDVLMERFEFEDEVIDVYRPLPETPFDRVGRYRRPVLKPT